MTGCYYSEKPVNSIMVSIIDKYQHMHFFTFNTVLV